MEVVECKTFFVLWRIGGFDTIYKAKLKDEFTIRYGIK